MKEKYEVLTQKLSQRKIPLSEYQCFLSYQETTIFPKLTERLKQQSIDLKQYFKFLESSPKISPLQDSQELQALATLGSQLLEEQRLQLSELNALLALLDSSFLLKNFLQKLLQCRKLHLEEFIDFWCTTF
jgi:hypothetical protein